MGVNDPLLLLFISVHRIYNNSQSYNKIIGIICMWIGVGIKQIGLLFLIMDSKKRSTISNTEYFPPGTYKWKLKQQLLAYGIANVAAKTLLAPLERWRIIAQTQIAYPLRPKKFSSIFDFLKKAPKEQGFTSLWRSNMTYCWIYFYQTVFQVTVFDSINSSRKEIIGYPQDYPILAAIFNNVFFPFMASTASLAVVYPIDTYRVHTAMSYHKNKSEALFRKFRERVSQVGSIKNMYQGFWAGSLISLINFNLFRHVGVMLGQIEVEGIPKELTCPQNILSVLAVALVHPLDSLKKILQLNNMSKPPIYSGYRSVFNYLKQNNLSALVFYRGFTASLVRSLVFMPLYWAIHRQWAESVLKL